MDKDDREEVIRLARECAVQLTAGDAFIGSGFFVAPGQVLTCAHVVSPHPAGSVRVLFAGAELAERCRTLLPPERGGGPTYALPDLALLTVDPPPGQPSVWLAAGPPATETKVLALGFSAETPGQGVQPTPALLTAVGPSGSFVRLKDDVLRAGMSGSLALDLDTHQVCGVVKASQDRHQSLGGWIVPVNVIRMHLPNLIAGNSAAHPPGTPWRDLVEGAEPPLDLVDGAGPLTERELRDLRREVNDALAAKRVTLSALFDMVFDRLRELPEEPLQTADDLLQELDDSFLLPDGTHPLRRLRRVLRALPADGADVAVAADSAIVDPATIEIHLEQSGVQGRVRFKVWSRLGAARTPVMESAPDEPMSPAAARQALRAALRKAFELLSGPEHVLIELAVPLEFLGRLEEADEWWISNRNAPLGTHYPVLVRTLDRKAKAPESLPNWQRRWRALEAGDPVLSWVDCRAGDSVSRLHAEMQRQDDPTVLAVGYPPKGKARRAVLEAMYFAGMPAALWTRRPCAQRNKCGQGADDCVGRHFRRNLTAELADRPLRELPELVRRLRTDARAAPDGADHCGWALTLLWDDPQKRPPDRRLLTNPAERPAERSAERLERPAARAVEPPVERAAEQLVERAAERAT